MELLIKKIKTMKTKRFINGLALAFGAVMTMLFVGRLAKRLAEQDMSIELTSAASRGATGEHP